jgi:phage anti-repressor protein
MTTTDLVPVFAGTLAGQSTPLCNARDLHAALGADARFNDWIRRRIEEYGFTEGEDFYSILSKTRGRPATDYHLTLDMAKELAMIENNDKGRQVRRYFIACEKNAGRPVPVIPPSGDALQVAIAEAVKVALASQQLPAPNPKTMRIDPRRLIDIMTDLRKIYARLDALGMMAADLSPEWWQSNAVHGIGEPVSPKGM